MKKVQLLGLALVAVVAFSALAAATASAGTLPEWLNNGASITEPVATKTTGKLLLTDLTFGIAVECNGGGTGTVGPGKEDLTKTLSPTGCETKKGTCASPSATAFNLPWLTELGLKGTTVKDEILTESGFSVTCSGVIKDTCKAGAGVPVVLSVTNSPVEQEFPVAENENQANCSLGGSKSGDVSGKFKVEGESGSNKITIEP